MTVFHGILCFHSETGTEGGYWAFQDSEFITKTHPTYSPGREVYDATNPLRTGTVLQTWLRDGREFPDPMQKDPDYYKSTEWSKRGADPEAEARWRARWGGREWYGVSSDTPIVCLVKWEDDEEQMCTREDLLIEQWAYEGLHLLDTGDHIKVFRDGTVIFDGDINLHKYPLFTESAGGMWIHADQEGIDRAEWAQMFFDGLPAELTPKA